MCNTAIINCEAAKLKEGRQISEKPPPSAKNAPPCCRKVLRRSGSAIAVRIVPHRTNPLENSVLFCTLRRGWGWDNFIKEANTGEGRDFPQWLRPYLKYVLPALILIVFAMGYVPKFQIWLGLA